MAMTRKIFELSLIFLLLSCNDGLPQEKVQQNQLSYPWKFISPMPHGRYGHEAVFAKNGRIYVMGGQVFSVASGFSKNKRYKSWLISKFNNGRYSNLAYDLKTLAWMYMTSIPGAINEYFTFYDLEADKWSEKRKPYQNLSDKEKEKLINQDNIGKNIGKKRLKIYETDLFRQGNGVAIVHVLDNLIYWIGGQSFMQDVDGFVLPYNIQIDDWPKATILRLDGGSRLKTVYETNTPFMQEPRCDHQSVVIDGKIYVLGGWREETAVNKWGDTYNTGKDIVSKTIECYDPKTNRWEYRRPLGRERMTFAAVAGKDDKIYVFGGAAGMSDDPKTPILDTVEVYDPRSDSWSRRRPMPTPRYDHAAVLAADGRIYVMGGAESFGDISSAVYVYDPASDSWEQGPDMIIPRAALAAAATPEGKIFAIGGTDVGAYKNKKNWAHLTSLVPRSDLGDYEGKVQETVEVLDIFKWRKGVKK